MERGLLAGLQHHRTYGVARIGGEEIEEATEVKQIFCYSNKKSASILLGMEALSLIYNRQWIIPIRFYLLKYDLIL